MRASSMTDGEKRARLTSTIDIEIRKLRRPSVEALIERGRRAARVSGRTPRRRGQVPRAPLRQAKTQGWMLGPLVLNATARWSSAQGGRAHPTKSRQGRGEQREVDRRRARRPSCMNQSRAGDPRWPRTRRARRADAEAVDAELDAGTVPLDDAQDVSSARSTTIVPLRRPRTRSATSPTPTSAPSTPSTRWTTVRAATAAPSTSEGRRDEARRGSPIAGRSAFGDERVELREDSEASASDWLTADTSERQSRAKTCPSATIAKLSVEVRTRRGRARARGGRRADGEDRIRRHRHRGLRPAAGTSSRTRPSDRHRAYRAPPRLESWPRSDMSPSVASRSAAARPSPCRR